MHLYIQLHLCTHRTLTHTAAIFTHTLNLHLSECSCIYLNMDALRTQGVSLGMGQSLCEEN